MANENPWLALGPHSTTDDRILPVTCGNKCRGGPICHSLAAAATTGLGPMLGSTTSGTPCDHPANSRLPSALSASRPIFAPPTDPSTSRYLHRLGWLRGNGHTGRLGSDSSRVLDQRHDAGRCPPPNIASPAPLHCGYALTRKGA